MLYCIRCDYQGKILYLKNPEDKEFKWLDFTDDISEIYVNSHRDIVDTLTARLTRQKSGSFKFHTCKVVDIVATVKQSTVYELKGTLYLRIPCSESINLDIDEKFISKVIGVNEQDILTYKVL